MIYKKQKIEQVEGNVTLSRICSVSNEEYKVTITKKEYEALKARTENIQDVFPNMSPDDREFLISGTTPAEWDRLMSE